LTSGLDGGECSASSPGHFTPMERAHQKICQEYDVPISQHS